MSGEIECKKQMLEKLIIDVHLLNSGSNTLFLSVLEKRKLHYSKQIEKMNIWKEHELKANEKEFEGTKKCVDDDIDHYKEEFLDSKKKIMREKITDLRALLSHPYEYFLQEGASLYKILEITPEISHEYCNLERFGFLSSEEIDQELSYLNEVPISVEFQGKSLIINKIKYISGDTIRIKMNDLDPIDVLIVSISKDTVNIQPQNISEEIRIAKEHFLSGIVEVVV